MDRQKVKIHGTKGHLAVVFAGQRSILDYSSHIITVRKLNFA